MTLLAGLARATLHPQPRAYLIGYGNRLRGSVGVRDDLTATALVLEDAGPGAAAPSTRRAAILALDLLCLHEDVVARIRDRLGALGFAADAVLVACSHTHAAPVAHPGARLAWRRGRWIDRVVGAAADAVLRARGALAPAALFAGSGEAAVSVNRRERAPSGAIVLGANRDGFVDRELGVAQLRAPGGAIRATLVSFACHPTVLGPTNRLVSAEWPGVARREIEWATGAPCVFLQGATANVNPDTAWGRGEDESMERLGREVAARALEIASRLAPLPATPLRAARGEVEIPILARRGSGGRPVSYRETAARRLGVPRSLVDPLLAYAYPWRPRHRAAPDGGIVLPMEIQALRVGELGLVAFAAEVFAEIGAAVKARSPLRPTLFVGYANGCVGYLPTAAACAEGGYEIEEAPLAYRVSGTYAPESESLAVDAALALLARLGARGASAA